MSHVEKRRVQRVVPVYPIPASLSGSPVSIIDLSTVGARIEHESPLTGGKAGRLNFAYLAEKFSLEAEVVCCKLHRSAANDGKVTYNAGLRFTDAGEPSRLTLRRLVAALLLRSLEKPEMSGQMAEARYRMNGK